MSDDKKNDVVISQDDYRHLYIPNYTGALESGFKGEFRPADYVYTLSRCIKGRVFNMDRRLAEVTRKMVSVQNNLGSPDIDLPKAVRELGRMSRELDVLRKSVYDTKKETNEVCGILMHGANILTTTDKEEIE